MSDLCTTPSAILARIHIGEKITFVGVSRVAGDAPGVKDREWNFGDETIVIGERAPNYYCLGSGEYTVRLRVSNRGHSSQAAKSNIVTVL